MSLVFLCSNVQDDEPHVPSAEAKNRPSDPDQKDAIEQHTRWTDQGGASVVSWASQCYMGQV